MTAIGRVYSGQASSVSTGTATLDLVSVYSASAAPNGPIRIHEVSVGFEGVTTAQMVKIQHRKAVGTTFTTGSGGTAMTAAMIVMLQPGGAYVVPTSSARFGDTTPMAAGTGAMTTSRSETVQVLNGYQFLPNSDEDRPFLTPTTVTGVGFAVNLAALASALTYDALVVWEELS